MFEEIVEEIQKLCEGNSSDIMSEEEEYDVMCGGCGQYDDTYTCGVEQGEAVMAKQVLDLINEALTP